jgi:hypothetical protein
VRFGHNGFVSGVRIAYLAAYAALAALGEALLARPALLWLRGQGILRAALPWEVPLGGLAFLLALLVAGATLFLATQAALGRRLQLSQHAAFLLLLALAFALRSQAGEPRPPPDPSPALLAGLRAVALELDRDYRDGYAPNAAKLDLILAQLPPPGFRRLGRTLPLRVRVLPADAAQIEALVGDAPGTIYIALSKDRASVWLTALSLPGVLKLSSGKPALIEAHAGTHSLPGRDPIVPAYPGMRSVTQPTH